MRRSGAIECFWVCLFFLKENMQKLFIITAIMTMVIKNNINIYLMAYFSVELKMNAASFCAKRAEGPGARVVLLDSADSDEEDTPKPGNETSSSQCTEDGSSSSDEDADGPPHAPPSAADARGRAATTAQRKRQKGSLEDGKAVPVWQDALPDAETIRLFPGLL